MTAAQICLCVFLVWLFVVEPLFDALDAWCGRWE